MTKAKGNHAFNANKRAYDNEIVIFNYNLIHETGKFGFKEGF